MDQGTLAKRRQLALDKIADKLGISIPPKQAKYDTGHNELFALEAIAEAELGQAEVEFGEDLQEKLMEIQGIGPATAEKIVSVIREHVASE